MDNMIRTVLTFVSFSSTCPKCRITRSQRGNRAAVQRLLDSDYPVEAYCEVCNECWPISPGERAEIARAVAS